MKVEAIIDELIQQVQRSAAIQAARSHNMPYYHWSHYELPAALDCGCFHLEAAHCNKCDTAICDYCYVRSGPSDWCMCHLMDTDSECDTETE